MSPSKKILILGPLHPYRGGISHFSDALRRTLATRSEYILETLNFSRLYPKFFFPGKTQFEPEMPSQLQSENAVIDTLNPLTWYATARRIATSGSRLVILPFWEPLVGVVFGFILLMCKRMTPNMPAVIVVAHNASAHDRRIGGDLMMCFLLRRARHIITLSDNVTLALKARLPSASVVQLFLPTFDHFGSRIPIAEARLRLGVSQNRKVLLFFGLIRTYKGLHTLIDAVKLVNERLPDILLIVAGEFYEEKESYQSQIQRYQLHNSVILVDTYIPGDEVPTYFSAADLLVLPYLTASQSAVLSVATHFQMPAIITSVLAPNMRDSDAQTVVPPNDPQALSSAILEHFSALDKHSSLKEHHQPLDRDWNAFCDSLLSLSEVTNL